MSFLPKKQAKSIGRSRAFNREMTSDPKVLLEKIRANLERIFVELHYKHYEIRNVTLLLINKNWESKKVHFEFQSYTHDKAQVFRELQKLFYTLYDETDIYRKTGVFSSDIRSFNTKQLSLFGSENEHFTKSV